MKTIANVMNDLLKSPQEYTRSNIILSIFKIRYYVFSLAIWRYLLESNKLFLRKKLLRVNLNYFFGIIFITFVICHSLDFPPIFFKLWKFIFQQSKVQNRSKFQLFLKVKKMKSNQMSNQLKHFIKLLWLSKKKPFILVTCFDRII